MQKLNFLILLLALLLTSQVVSDPDCFQQFPSTLYFSERVAKNKWSMPIQDYIHKQFPYQSQDISFPIIQQEKFTNLNLSNGIKGAAYPLFLNFTMVSDKILRINAFNMSNQDLIGTYQLSLNFSSQRCDVIYAQRNYQNHNILLNQLRFFTICQNKTHQIARYDTFHDLDKEPNSRFFNIRLKQLNYTKKVLQRESRTNYQDSIAIVYYRGESQLSLIQWYFYNGSVQPTIINATTMKKSNYMNSFILKDYLLASGNQFYIQKNYGLIFRGSLFQDNWNTLEVNNTFYRVLAFCQSNFIAVRSQKYIYFLQFIYNIEIYSSYSYITGLFQAARVNRPYNKDSNIFTVGKYLVESNSTHWHIYQYKSKLNKVEEMTIRFEFTSIIIDQFLCKSNSFYIGNTKFSIGQMRLNIPKQNKTITLKNKECSKQVEIKIVKENQMIFTNQRILNSENNQLQLIQQLYYGDRFQGVLQTNSKDIPYELYQKHEMPLKNDSEIMNFITIDFETVAFIQKKISNASYTVNYCKNTTCSIVYSYSINSKFVQTYMGKFIHPMQQLPYFYVYIRKQRNSQFISFYYDYYKKLYIRQFQVWAEQPFTFMGIDQWMKYQIYSNIQQRFLFALTNYIENCSAHGYVQKNGWSISSSYEILTTGFSSCSSTIYNEQQILLMYRHDSDSLRLMSISSPNKAYVEHKDNSDYQFRILNQKQFPQFRNAKIKCIESGLAVLQNNHIVLINGNLDFINEIFLKGSVQTDIFTLNHVLHKSETFSNKIQVINLRNGFNQFNIQGVQFNKIAQNYLSNGFMLKNGTFFNFYLKNIVIEQDFQQSDLIYLRVKNQTKQNFRIYQVDNWNTLQLIDNRVSLVLKNAYLNDSIWNSTVDSIFQNNKHLTHFIDTLNPFLDNKMQYIKQSFKSQNKNYFINDKEDLKYSRTFIRYNQQFLVQNQQMFILLVSFFENWRYSYIEYEFKDKYYQSIFNEAQLLSAYVDNKTNTIYAKIRSKSNVCIMKTSIGEPFNFGKEQITQKNSYCFRKPLPYLINQFQQKNFWQNNTYFSLQAGTSNWNTSFYDFYSNNINQSPRDANLQYDNYQIQNKKVSIYSLDSLKFQDIDGISYGFVDQKLLDFVKIKYNNSLYLLILFQKHLILQKYQSKDFVQLNLEFYNIGNFIKIQTCFLSQNVYEYLLISSNKNHSTLSLNWSQYPKTSIFQFKQTLIHDKKYQMISGLCINRMTLILSADQVLYLYNMVDDKKITVFSCQKFDLYLQLCPQWWSRQTCVFRLQRINGDQIFIQSTQRGYGFYRIKQQIQLDPQFKLIKVVNDKSTKQYKILYTTSEKSQELEKQSSNLKKNQISAEQ